MNLYNQGFSQIHMIPEKSRNPERLNSLKDLKLILASSSPRRAEILKREGVNFEILIPEKIEEKDICLEPVSHVLELSKRKAESVLEKVKDGLILGADTVVVLGDKILGKPKDQREAFLFLKTLSGKTHRVYTGITVIHKKSGKVKSDYGCTEVKFNQLKSEDILKYIATGEPMDKAGAYGIQGIGSFLVENIKGDLDSVIGLPVKKLKRLLEQFCQS